MTDGTMLDLRLDHVVIAVRNLDAAAEGYTALLGRSPSWRGEHPVYGTSNVLYRLDNTYVELLAAGDKRGKGSWRREFDDFVEQHGEGLFALALGTGDIDATVAELKARDLEVERTAAGHGIDEVTGARRDWRNARVPAKASRGARMFFIEHGSPPEALPAAAPRAERGIVRRLDHAVVLSADMQATQQLWSDTLGVRLALDRTFPDRNTRILFYRLGDITVEVSGGAQQTREGLGKPDRLWGLAWEVDNVEAASLRLRAAGIDCSGPRPGIKPGTRVATVHGSQSRGVATLLIEHLAESFQPESRLPQAAASDAALERRAFTAAALDHVVLSTPDLSATAAKWANVLGLETAEIIEPAGMEMRLATLPAGNAFVELVQPLTDDHRVARAIAERGQGMFSLSILVADLDAAVAGLHAKGVPVGEAEAGVFAGTRVARIDPSATHGVPLQLIERRGAG